jgi:hypothetical protein
MSGLDRCDFAGANDRWRWKTGILGSLAKGNVAKPRSIFGARDHHDPKQAIAVA